jgi:putative oxidoreductase
MEKTHDLTLLVGRCCLMLIFVLGGFEKLMHPPFWAKIMVAQGVPLVHITLPLTILIELGLSLLIVFGYYARPAAAIMFLWFIPVTIMFHVIPHHQALLNHQMMVAAQQRTNFLKNIAIMGGLIMIAGIGPGRFSINGARRGADAASPRAAA